MTNAQTNSALAAVDAMHVALIALNEADGPYAIEARGTLYGDLKSVLVRTLAAIGVESLDLDHVDAVDAAESIYGYMVETGESVDAAMRYVGGLWAGEGIYGVRAGARIKGVTA